MLFFIHLFQRIDFSFQLINGMFGLDGFDQLMLHTLLNVGFHVLDDCFGRIEGGFDALF